MGWNEVRDTQTWANVHVTFKNVLWNTRNCDVRGVLFTPPVGCSRLLSAVNDLTTTKKKSSKCQSEQLSEEASSTSRPVLWCCSFHELKGIDFDEFTSSTNDHSTATMMCWMKKTTDSNSDTGGKESVQVALHQTRGGDGRYLLLIR